MRLARCVAAVLSLFAVHGVFALPVVDQLFAMRMQSSANSNNFATGDILFWGANSVPGGASFWGITRQCPTGGNCSAGPPPTGPSVVGQALYHRPFTLIPDQYFASRPYDPAHTGPWTMIVSSQTTRPPPGQPFDPATTTIVNTPAVGNVGQMPFVPSMTVTGAGLTPTLSWTLPSAGELSAAGVALDRVRIQITDNTPGFRVTTTSRSPTFSNSFDQGDLIGLTVVASGSSVSTITSYSIPSGVLTSGHQYSIGILLEDARGDGTALSRSSSYFDFTPLGSSIANSVYLPTTVPVPTTSGLTSGAPYSFNQVPASPNSVTFIDPVVATGFEYHTGGGADPNFRTVQIVTAVGNGVYEVWLWDGTNWLLVDPNLAVNEVFDFTNFDLLGVDQFQIRGIETSAGVSPFNITAFVTGLTFMSEGTFNGTMQALVIEVAAIPEPPMLGLLLVAFAVLGFRRRVT